MWRILHVTDGILHYFFRKTLQTAALCGSIYYGISLNCRGCRYGGGYGGLEITMLRNDTIKIGILNDSFPPVIDGVASTVVNYAATLSSGYDNIYPFVITPRYPEPRPIKYNFKVIRYPSVKIMPRVPYRVGNPFSPSTIRKVRREKPDLLHVHCPFISMTAARCINSSRHPIPIIFTYHTKFDIDISRYVHNRVSRKIAKTYILSNIHAADEVWVVSNGAGEDLRREGYTGEYVVMHGGTDFTTEPVPTEQLSKLDAEYGIRPNEKVFLYVGRMMWYKNIRLILESLAEVKKSGMPFRAFFVGDGLDRSDIEKTAQTIGLGENTVFTGAVRDRDRLKVFFSRADMFLFPSTYDTAGLVVTEAAACRCPSLLTAGSPAAENVIDGVNGFLTPEDPALIASKIVAAVGSGNLKNIGNTALDTLYRSWDQSVEEAVKRYELLLDRTIKKRSIEIGI